MGDNSSAIHPVIDEENEFRITALINADGPPSDNWTGPVSPWDYNPVVKKGKSKRQSIDSNIVKIPRGISNDGKKKVNTNHTPRDKRKVNRKSFKYYPDIRIYIREYREITKTLTFDYKNCSCHGGYTKKDVDKVYETLPNIKKSSATESADKVKDEAEDVVETPPSSNSCATPVINQTKKTREYPVKLPRESLKQDPKDNLDDFICHTLGRDFFMSPQYSNKKATSCPVIKITLPEAHDVRRVSRCGSESPQKGLINDSPTSIQSATVVSSLSQTFTDIEEPPSNRSSSFAMTYPSDDYEGVKISKRQKKETTLSAKVRDFRPFSRNGLSTRVSKAIREKQRRRVLLETDGMKNDFTKQEIPWKVLRYLGYSPSMRKYLHDIYSPVERKQSKSPLVMSSRKCFDDCNRLDSHKASEQSSKNCQSVLPETTAQKLSVSHLFNSDKSSVTRRSDPSNLLVENYLHVCRQERPKLAILPKLDTVVKPRVMNKFTVK